MTPRRRFVGTILAGLILSAAVAQGGEALPSVAEGVRPVLVGTTVPEGSLRTPEGRETTLEALRAGRPTVLVFYRGHW